MSKTSVSGIRVVKAREHNLKSIDVFIPRNQITVITGVSGSGKSSLAFDTIYAEGQRRYVESLSTYARQFMDSVKKPDVEALHGLSPAIAIDQKTISVNPRSTVGTLTESYDDLRLLMARAGVPVCPTHHIPVQSQTLESLIHEVYKGKKGEKFYVLAPVAQLKKGEFTKEFRQWIKKGFVKARINGEWVELAQAKKLNKHKRHTIDLLIDRLVLEEKFKKRLQSSIELALDLADGQVIIEALKGDSQLYSLNLSCPKCGYTFPELEPRVFSFNNPRGACEECNGMGYVDVDLEDEEGDEDLEPTTVCPSCQGKRLKKESLNVFFDEKNIFDLGAMSITDLYEFFQKHLSTSKKNVVLQKILTQLLFRLQYLMEVGTGYLSLNRMTKTLSGGEAQRLRLASQMGSALVGVLYVLDEPSIGLHPRDHHRLLNVLKQIKERGNTILLVEHDEDTIRSADLLIDIGPGAGLLGGEVMAVGTPEEVSQNPKSLTGQYLSHKKEISVPQNRRSGNGLFLKIKGAKGHNLKNVSVNLPLGQLLGFSGVSGSGKSTLVRETLFKTLSQKLNRSLQSSAPVDKIEGIEHIDKVIEINQKPIGRTPRSIPATYVDLYPLIRNLFSNLPESKVRGYRPGDFSFNVKGGRCEECQGMGQIKVEMSFLSNVFVQCDRCQGHRFTTDILNIRYRDKNISDVLSMNVDEALEFFTHHATVARKLKTLQRVGLGYMKLGQSSTTLSGGEAQRVKLSKELSKRPTGKTLYILDEPTTGLHFEDISKLVSLLHELVDYGNSVFVIEHNLDVLKNCDSLVDLGPDGGVGGGQIVAQGPPEEVVKIKSSLTGQFLKPLLKRKKISPQVEATL